MIAEKHKQVGDFYYCPHEVLGVGSWGTVYKARNLNNDKLYALKKINKFKIESSQSTFEKYKNEVLALQKGVDIKQLIKFVDFFKSKSNYYIITQYQAGSFDLYNYMKQNPSKFTQLQARIVWYDLLKGIHQLHKLKITHRDIKLQNILYIPEKKTAKIIDFGLAARFQQLSGRVGSIMFMSPQIIQNQPYSQKCDVWSLGIVFYCMVCKISPYGQNPTANRILEIMKQIDASKKLVVPQGIYISEACQQLIKCCLKYDQSKRKDIQSLLKMPFFITPDFNQLKGCLDYYQPQMAFVN